MTIPRTDLVLRVEPHRGEPFSHAVYADSLVFGRSSKADLVVPDPYISRQQARLFRDGDRWLIEDLGGRNPTLLNGKALTQPERVAPGDLISFSETKVYVRDMVVIYTDGVTEAANPSGEEYGLERLVALCRLHSEKGVAKLAGALQQDLDAFANGVPFSDDRTFILLRRL